MSGCVSIKAPQAVRLFNELEVTTCSPTTTGATWEFRGGVQLELDDGDWYLGVAPSIDLPPIEVQ